MPTLDLGEKLKQAREEAGLDQKTAAAILNLDQGKISLIEKGARKVDAEKELPLFAKAYKKPIGWFYEDAEEVPQDESPINEFLKKYFPEYDFNDIQKKKLEKIMQKTLDIYIEDVAKTDKQKEKKSRGQRK